MALVSSPAFCFVVGGTFFFSFWRGDAFFILLKPPLPLFGTSAGIERGEDCTFGGDRSDFHGVIKEEAEEEIGEPSLWMSFVPVRCVSIVGIVVVVGGGGVLMGVSMTAE